MHFQILRERKLSFFSPLPLLQPCALCRFASHEHPLAPCPSNACHTDYIPWEGPLEKGLINLLHFSHNTTRYQTTTFTLLIVSFRWEKEHATLHRRCVCFVLWILQSVRKLKYICNQFRYTYLINYSLNETIVQFLDLLIQIFHYNNCHNSTATRCTEAWVECITLAQCNQP